MRTTVSNNNSLFWKLLSSATFIISAIFTILLITSQAISPFTHLLYFSMGLTLEISKYSFLGVAVNSHGFYKSLTIAISGVLIFLSVIASLSFMLNISSYNQGEIIQAQNERNRLNNEAEKEKVLKLQKIKEHEISAVKTSINELKEQRDNLPENYVTQKKEIQNRISDSELKLEQKYTELSQIIDSSPSNVEVAEVAPELENGITSKGYTAFLLSITKGLGVVGINTTVGGLELILFGTISVLFEVLAVLAYYQSRLMQGVKTNSDTGSSINTSSDINTEKVIGFSPRINTDSNISLASVTSSEPKVNTQNTNASDVAIDNTKFTTEQLELYKDTIGKNLKKNNKCLGYRKLAEIAGISQETAYSIMQYLKEQNFVKVDGRNTFLVG